jgi:hypothetical protein
MFWRGLTPTYRSAERANTLVTRYRWAAFKPAVQFAFALRCEIRHYLGQIPQTATAARAEVFTLGKLIAVSAAKMYATRMAAVFMISLGTIWLKTGLMPRWLVVVSCMAALALLIAGAVSM